MLGLRTRCTFGFSTLASRSENAFSDKNILKNLQDEQKRYWNWDNRSTLFEKNHSNYLPSGSLLKVFYYSLPLPSGVALPLRPIIDTDSSVSSNTKQDGFIFNVASNPIEPEAKSVPSSAAFLKWWAANIQSSPSNNQKSAIAGGLYRPETLQPQSFVGRLIAVRRNSCNTTFVLRNAFEQVGVELSFSLYSPLLVAVQVISKHKQKKSKWYHLRDHPVHESIVHEPKSLINRPPPYHYLTPTKPASSTTTATPTTKKSAPSPKK
jgi:ribosomal protein L19